MVLVMVKVWGRKRDREGNDEGHGEERRMRWITLKLARVNSARILLHSGYSHATISTRCILGLIMTAINFRHRCRDK